jgi:hypothetical protein
MAGESRKEATDRRAGHGRQRVERELTLSLRAASTAHLRSLGHHMSSSSTASKLRLPLEVIERILYLALDGDAPLATPLTCVEPISPPVGTPQLLLVSKGIRELALPLYWRSITILRSDDWVKLWDPDQGLFTGKDGRQRAGWVKEIRVNLAPRAWIPISLQVLQEPFLQETYDDDDEEDYPRLRRDALFKLREADLPHFERVIFFHSDVGAETDDYGGRVGPRDAEWRSRAQWEWDDGRDDRVEVRYHEEHSDYDGPDEDVLESLVYEDEDAFGDHQTAREQDLHQQRHDRLLKLLGFDDGNFKAVAIPVDETAISLAVSQPGCKFPRVFVYLADYDRQGHSFRFVVGLDRGDTRYGFVGVAVDARERLAAEFVHDYGREVVEARWRWVDEGGSLIRIV